MAKAGNDTITVIRTDMNAIAATINLLAGVQPVSVVVNAAANKVYTANNGNNRVTVINGVDDSVLIMR